MARARRPSFKGCCAMCAGGKGRIRGQGHAQRAHTPEKRLAGRARRLGRREIPRDQMETR